jgi:hypothetical protein
MAIEPQAHEKYDVRNLLNNALVASVPKSMFVRKIINKVFSADTLRFKSGNKFLTVLNTTGPLMISRVYESLSPKERKSIHLIPTKNVMPFDVGQIKQINSGTINEELNNCLKEAYAIHYFTYTWGRGN